MTTCPSGVHYMHLVDHAREYIEQNYSRPAGTTARCAGCWRESCPIRRASASPFSRAWAAAFAPLLPKKLRCHGRLRAGLAAAGLRNDAPQVFPAQGERRRASR
jgi:glycolate oxidase iron-sulfur subunit